MKKKLLTITALLLLLLLLGGCGGGEYTGKWGCTGISFGTTSMTAGDLAASQGEIVFKLKQNGSGSFTAYGNTQGLRWYQQDDSALILILDGEEETFAVQGELLVWDSGTTVMTFARYDSEAYTSALATQTQNDFEEYQSSARPEGVF